MNLGQSFLIPLPRLTSEAVAMLTSPTVRKTCDVTAYLFLYFLTFIHSAFPLSSVGRLPLRHFFPPILVFFLFFFSASVFAVEGTGRNAQCLWQLERFPSLSRWTGNRLSQQNRRSFPPTARSSPRLAQTCTTSVLERVGKQQQTQNDTIVLFSICWEMLANT